MAKQANGAGSIRQRPDGLWEGRFSAGRDPATGRIVRKSVYGKTQREVRKKLTEATSAIDNGVYTDPTQITMGQWLTIWLNEYCKAIKPRTKALYQSTVEYRISPYIGAIKLPMLTPVMLQEFYNKSLDGQYKDRTAISAKTLRNIHGIVHKALQQAASVGYIKNNPATACVLPKVSKQEMHPLDDAQIKAFLHAVEHDPYKRLFLVTLFTGMREGEVLGLCRSAVYFEREQIKVERQLQLFQGKYVFMPPKNGKSRTITPAPFVMDLLREELQAQAEARLKAGPLWSNKDGFVFSDSQGQHLKRQTIYRHFKQAAAAIGLPNMRFHDLRHTYAVAAIRAGDDVKTVSENLGHASVAFTLDVYGHVTGDMKKASADKMQRYIDALQA